MEERHQEDWHFTIEVIKLYKEDDCRLYFEPGDIFTCTYETPGGFCVKSLLKLFPIMEAVRSGGDLRQLGGHLERQMEVDCPDGVVRYRITGDQVEG